MAYLQWTRFQSPDLLGIIYRRANRLDIRRQQHPAQILRENNIPPRYLRKITPRLDTQGKQHPAQILRENNIPLEKDSQTVQSTKPQTQKHRAHSRLIEHLGKKTQNPPAQPNPTIRSIDDLNVAIAPSVLQSTIRFTTQYFSTRRIEFVSEGSG